MYLVPIVDFVLSEKSKLLSLKLYKQCGLFEDLVNSKQECEHSRGRRHSNLRCNIFHCKLLQSVALAVEFIASDCIHFALQLGSKN